MQLLIANAPHWFMLNDQTVDILAEMCKTCTEFCSICAENVNIVETEEVYILDEERLKRTLKEFNHVDGIEHLAKK